MFLAFLKIKLWTINSANFSRELEFSSSANPGNESISHSREERVSVISLAADHVNQSVSVSCVSGSAVGTTESATNIENYCRGPPPPCQGLVIEGDATRAFQSTITNTSYSIQEQPPPYQVSSTEHSELEVIQNVTNTTCSSQLSSLAHELLPAEDNRVETIQNVTDDTYTEERLPPTYEEAVTIFTESGAIQGVLNVWNSIQDLVQTYSAVTDAVSGVCTVQTATNLTYSGEQY